MPLHLLGKKSWNVYNADNIARVRRDEAAARAREEADEQRMQEEDAARRLAILRGEDPPPLPSSPGRDGDPGVAEAGEGNRGRDGDGGKETESRYGAATRRKRKRIGEDDTDFEMRVARERGQVGGQAVATPKKPGPASAGGSIVDHKGNIDLFGEAERAGSTREEKNPEAEREKTKKKREMEDQYTMRFANAAGRDGFREGGPWYAKGGDAEMGEERRTDAWGNEDQGRAGRDAVRTDRSDPLHFMKGAAKKVREVEQSRRKEREERERELKVLRREERRREKRRKRERGREADTDDLEGFTLDAIPKDDRAASRDGDRDRNLGHRHGEEQRRHGERRHHRSRDDRHDDKRQHGEKHHRRDRS